MISVKARTTGRWRVAPGTSIDVQAGKIYEVSLEFAKFLVDGRAAEYVTGTKPTYEKQSEVARFAPNFESKEEAAEWAKKHCDIEIDKRKSLKNIQEEIKEACESING